MRRDTTRRDATRSDATRRDATRRDATRRPKPGLLVDSYRSVAVDRDGETWARAPAPYDDFEVSILGRVRNASTKVLRTPRRGVVYDEMEIGGKHVRVHVLVMLTWVGLPPVDKPVSRRVRRAALASGQRPTRPCPNTWAMFTHAAASPAIAARSHQATAATSSFSTPRPRAYNTARSNMARGTPPVAAAR